MNNTKIYNKLPDSAIEIRKEVFINEQGFKNEFDETDSCAVHIVLFDENGNAAATCRVYKDDTLNSYVLGRLAVLKAYRGKHLGTKTVKAAEEYVFAEHGECLSLHSQCAAKEFYEKLGFVEYGAVDDDEGCPHIWMKKQIK
jgi:predicted GNAT family N-acyltransferase